jgi:hypothetical protein
LGRGNRIRLVLNGHAEKVGNNWKKRTKRLEQSFRALKPQCDYPYHNVTIRVHPRTLRCIVEHLIALVKVTDQA